ncbi:HAD family hydrolase [Conyzicola sp.]|uniref:HAD family hydrolase n=1 Tax=Conyzicola sp. TaxID=1969404 RepID=UPI003988BBDA
MGELTSWRDGPTKQAIEAFVAGLDERAVPREQRVAVFDNDGTLWAEKPMPTQLHYLLQQWAAAASADPSLAQAQPYAAAVSGDFAWLGGAIDKHYAGDDSDLHAVVRAIVRTTDGMSVEDYEASVSDFYAKAHHLTLKKPYSGAVYQPMIELLRYLEANGFTCYIVSGGERDFMRPMTMEYYGIPPERVVGSALGLQYTDDGTVRYGSELAFLDDGPEKPVRIWTRIGRRPMLAGGNSNGDVPMLDYTSGLRLLIHHDDDTGRGDVPYDKGAEAALAAARQNGYTVVSVKNDWSRVFPD